MILVMAVTGAFAGAPEGVDVFAVEEWQDRAIRLRRGPEGCYELEGTARHHIAVFRPPNLFSRGEQTDYVYDSTFSGRLDDGQWTDFTAETTPVSEAAKADANDGDDSGWSVAVHPLVGRGSVTYSEREGDDNGEGGLDDSTDEAVTLLDAMLDALDGDVSTAFAEWSDERSGVELTERYPLGDSKKQVELVTFFPDGDPAGTALDVRFPNRVKVAIDGAPITVRLLRPQVHVRTQTVDGEPIPVYESLSAAAGALGFTVGLEQRLVYQRAIPCSPTAAAPDSAEPDLAEPDPAALEPGG